MRAFRFPVLVALSLSACAGKAPIEATVCALPLPAELDRAVQVQSAAGLGWAAPVSSFSALTVQHLVGNGVLKYTDSRGRTGVLGVIWQDEKRDLALLQVLDEHEFLSWYAIAEKAPMVGDPVYARSYLLGHAPTATRGWWMGVDGQGDCVVDGWSHPGASGSPVLDQAGRIVGLSQGSGNWSNERAVDHTLAERFDTLSRMVAFRAASTCKPISGGMPKARD